jgi:hypothetical protein
MSDPAKAEALFKQRAEAEQKFRDAETARLEQMRSMMAKQKAARLARNSAKASNG